MRTTTFKITNENGTMILNYNPKTEFLQGNGSIALHDESFLSGTYCIMDVSNSRLFNQLEKYNEIGCKVIKIEDDGTEVEFITPPNNIPVKW